MDGVLVEVTESYCASIQATVKHFTGSEPTRPEIQDWKNRGGYNDDWKLSHSMILERGAQPTYDEVVHHFQKLFLGENNDGLILREEWVAKDGLFERLAINNTLSVFTGRFRWEANLTLDRFLPGVFNPIVGVDDVTNAKPNPEGLLKIRDTVPHKNIWYIGDTVDDARASSAAKVPFIGIAARANPRYDELVSLLKNGRYEISTGIRFFNHMLELFTKHGGFDLKLTAKGDLDVDQHHTVEDVGIVMGQLFAKALGDRKGINRAGYFVLPMDETLCVVAVDLGGRPALVYKDRVKVRLVGDLQSELMTDFFDGFVHHAGANLHAKILYGRSNHHKIEAIFKCWARAMRYACSTDARLKDQLPSTKGLL